MGAEFSDLPFKLSAAVKEYLRQRQSGSLTDHWEVASRLAQLLRAASLADGGAAAAETDSHKLLITTRDILLAHDDATLTIHGLFNFAKTHSDLSQFVESVRAAPDELSDVLCDILNGPGQTAVYGRGSEHKLVLRALERSSDAVLINDLTKISHYLQTVKRCVIVARAIHPEKGIAAATGAHVLARAANRLNIPLIIVGAQFCQLSTSERVACTRRSHPGKVKLVDIGDTKVEIITRSTSWIPHSLVQTIVTENGGVSSLYYVTKQKV